MCLGDSFAVTAVVTNHSSRAQISSLSLSLALSYHCTSLPLPLFLALSLSLSVPTYRTALPTQLKSIYLPAPPLPSHLLQECTVTLADSALFLCGGRTREDTVTILPQQQHHLVYALIPLTSGRVALPDIVITKEQQQPDQQQQQQQQQTTAVEVARRSDMFVFVQPPSPLVAT